MRNCICGSEHPHINIGGHTICTVKTCGCLEYQPVQIRDTHKSDFDQFQADIAQVKQTMSDLNKVMLERTDELRIMFTSLIARQHAIFYGLAGSGKSQMVRTFAEATSRSYFEYQIHQSTTLDELYGPWDLIGMKNTGLMRRVIDGLMLDKQIVFLDEITNSSSPIRNALKPMMNERQYPYGREMRYAPLESLFSAANAILDTEDATEAAFTDRFLARKTVQYLREDASMEAMLMARNGRPTISRISPEVISRLQSEVKHIQMTPQFAQQAISLRKQIVSEGIVSPVSDRRFNQTMDLAAAHAVLAGRRNLRKSDLVVFAWTFWNDPDHEQRLYEYVKAVVETATSKIEALDQSTQQIFDAFIQSLDNPAFSSDSPASKLQKSVMAKASLEGQKQAINSLKKQAEDQDEIDAANEVLRKIAEFQKEIEIRSLDLHDQEAASEYDDLDGLKKVR